MFFFLLSFGWFFSGLKKKRKKFWGEVCELLFSLSLSLSLMGSRSVFSNQVFYGGGGMGEVLAFAQVVWMEKKMFKKKVKIGMEKNGGGGRGTKSFEGAAAAAAPPFLSSSSFKRRPGRLPQSRPSPKTKRRRCCSGPKATKSSTEKKKKREKTRGASRASPAAPRARRLPRPPAATGG